MQKQGERTSDIIKRREMEKANKGLLDSKKINRGQFEAIYGSNPLTANLNPNELNIDFEKELKFKALLDEVLKTKSDKLKSLEKSFQKYNETKQDYIWPTLCKLDGMKGKFGVTNTYKNYINQMDNEANMCINETNLEIPMTLELEAKLVDVQKDINIIKTRNYYQTSYNYNMTAQLKNSMDVLNEANLLTDSSSWVLRKNKNFFVGKSNNYNTKINKLKNLQDLANDRLGPIEDYTAIISSNKFKLEKQNDQLQTEITELEYDQKSTLDELRKLKKHVLVARNFSEVKRIYLNSVNVSLGFGTAMGNILAGTGKGLKTTYNYENVRKTPLSDILGNYKKVKQEGLAIKGLNGSTTSLRQKSSISLQNNEDTPKLNQIETLNTNRTHKQKSSREIQQSYQVEEKLSDCRLYKKTPTETKISIVNSVNSPRANSSLYNKNFATAPEQIDRLDQEIKNMTFGDTNFRGSIDILEHSSKNLLRSHKFRGTRWGANYEISNWGKHHHHNDEQDDKIICGSSSCGHDMSIQEEQNILLNERKELMVELDSFYSINNGGARILCNEIVKKYKDLKNLNENIRLKSTSLESELNLKQRLLKDLNLEVNNKRMSLIKLSKNHGLAETFGLVSEDHIATSTGQFNIEKNVFTTEPNMSDSPDKMQTTVSIMRFYCSNESLGNGLVSIKATDNFLIDNYFKMSQVIDKVSNTLEQIEYVIDDLSANIGFILKQPMTFLKTKKQDSISTKHTVTSPKFLERIRDPKNPFKVIAYHDSAYSLWKNVTHLSRFATVFGTKDRMDTMEETSTYTNADPKQTIENSIKDIHKEYSTNLLNKYNDLEKILGFQTNAVSQTSGSDYVRNNNDDNSVSKSTGRQSMMKKFTSNQQYVDEFDYKDDRPKFTGHIKLLSTWRDSMKHNVESWMKYEENPDEKHTKKKSDFLMSELENGKNQGKFQTVATVEAVNDKIDIFIEDTGAKKYKFEQLTTNDEQMFKKSVHSAFVYEGIRLDDKIEDLDDFGYLDHARQVLRSPEVEVKKPAYFSTEVRDPESNPFETKSKKEGYKELVKCSLVLGKINTQNKICNKIDKRDEGRKPNKFIGKKNLDIFPTASIKLEKRNIHIVKNHKSLNKLLQSNCQDRSKTFMHSTQETWSAKRGASSRIKKSSNYRDGFEGYDDGIFTDVDRKHKFSIKTERSNTLSGYRNSAITMKIPFIENKTLY